MSETILAVDLGGTHFRSAVASTANPAEIRLAGEWPAPATLRDFLAMLERQLGQHGARLLGLGIPGLAQGNICRWVPNLPYLDGLDLSAHFPNVTIGLGNDAQLALLAELSAGAAQGMNDAVLLAVGTGIGSAVLAGGRIVAGSRGGACSFGWAVADLADTGEDRRGWLERQTSGRALDRVASLLGLSDGAALVEAARTGNSLAIEALTKPMQALGAALAGAVALLDPEAIILDGGVARSLDALGPLIHTALRRQLPPHLRTIQLRPGRFGSQAGLIGAAFAGARGEGWRTNHG